jgi:hypothetical protein
MLKILGPSAVVVTTVAAIAGSVGAAGAPGETLYYGKTSQGLAVSIPVK